MVISEIFHSIQGEGPTAGRPAVFVRLGMCNLRCNFCDTAYTWKPGEEDYSDMTNQSVMEQVAALLQMYQHTRLIVWTGGEPMLQQRNIVAAIDSLNVLFPDRFLEHEVETNGTILPQPELDLRINRYNCSPKTALSGNASYAVRIRGSSKTTYKYVVGTAAHCAEALQDIDCQKLPRQRCMFMVLGTTADDMIGRGKVIAEICKKEGITLCLRIQSLLWDSERRT